VEVGIAGIVEGGGFGAKSELESQLSKSFRRVNGAVEVEWVGLGWKCCYCQFKKLA